MPPCTATQWLVERVGDKAVVGHREVAALLVGEKADAQFLVVAARCLDETDFQRHLRRGRDGSGIDRILVETLGDLACLRSGCRALCLAGNDDASVGSGGLDAAIVQCGVERTIDFACVRPDLDVQHADQFARLVVERDTGGAGLAADHVESAIGKRRDNGDIGVAYDDFAEHLVGAHGARFALGDTHDLCSAGVQLHDAVFLGVCGAQFQPRPECQHGYECGCRRQSGKETCPSVRCIFSFHPRKTGVPSGLSQVVVVIAR